MNLRGRYEGGGMVVTAKHWWSPKERKAARLAAKVIAYQVAKTQREVIARLVRGY
jgi:hypothetical protein